MSNVQHFGDIESLATEQALMMVEVAVIAASGLVFAVRFSQALESALASREGRTLAGAAAD